MQSSRGTRRLSSRIFTFLALASACVAGMLSIGPVQAAPPVTGGIYITTLPSGADVWVDGTYVGRAPVLVDTLAQGTHEVTLTKTSWTAQEAHVQVSGGSVGTFITKLVPRTASTELGSFAVRGNVRLIQLSVDDVTLPLGKASYPLAAGVHILNASSSQGNYTRSFIVFEHTETEVLLHATPIQAVGLSPVRAAAEDYLDSHEIELTGTKFVIRHGGHILVGYLGDPSIRYDGAPLTYETTPTVISAKLYLPFDLLQKLTHQTAK